MAAQKCDYCGRLFKDGQEVQATVLCNFKALKSDIHYALSHPHDVLTKRCYPDCYTEKEPAYKWTN